LNARLQATCVGGMNYNPFAMQRWEINERKTMENCFQGKSAIVIGERDGVQGPSIAQCVEAAGGKVLYAVTECFV
jgi:glycine/sarcosine/betaine reductase complex component A